MKKWNWLFRLILSAIFFNLAMSPLFAQLTKIQGTVVSRQGESLPGVSIVEKGTVNGTVTGNAGDFSLELKTADPVVIFSFVGYKNSSTIK